MTECDVYFKSLQFMVDDIAGNIINATIPYISEF